MSKILIVDAFKTMVDYVNSNNYDKANEVMRIISRSQEQDRKNNVLSNYIELKGKKDEKYFNKELIIID